MVTLPFLIQKYPFKMNNMITELFEYVEYTHGSIGEYIKEIYHQKFKEAIAQAFESGARMERNHLTKNEDVFDADTYFQNNHTD